MKKNPKVFIGNKCYKRQLLRPNKCMDYYQFFHANLSDLEYFEYVFQILHIFITGHKFVVEIANCYQIWNLEITLLLNLTILLAGNFKILYLFSFSISITNCCSVIQLREKYMSIFGTRQFSGSCLYKLWVFFLSISIACLGHVLLLYSKGYGISGDKWFKNTKW